MPLPYQRLITSFIWAAAIPPALAADDPTRLECSVSAAQASSAPSVLIVMAKECDGHAQVAAIARLFAVKLPTAPKLALSPAVPLPMAEQVAYELDVFYDVLLPYPPPEAFEKLDQLVARLSKSFTIRSVSVSGGVDSDEVEMEIASRLASARAHLVQQYLAEAKVLPLQEIKLAVRKPTHGDSPEGRARDRVAEIKVVAYRAKNGQ